MGNIINNRIVWVDNFRGICAFCVLLAHCGHCPSLYLQLYTPFFLVGFFFLSGYCYKIRGFKEELLKVFKGLVIPYFFFAFVINLGRSNVLPIFDGDFTKMNILLSDFLSGIKLWFIPCLIMCQLYFILLVSIPLVRKNINRVLPIVMIICWGTMFFLRTEVNISRFDYKPAFWYCDTALFGLGFFLLGYYLKINEFSKYLLVGYRAYIAVLVYSFAIWIINYFFDVEFHFITNYYTSLGYFIIFSLLGVYVMSSFCDTFRFNFLQKLGSNTLLLFALNWHVLIFLINYCKLDFLLNILPDYIWAILISIIQSIIILLISYPINKYIPWIVGKK